jgi:hypothetical protein
MVDKSPSVEGELRESPRVEREVVVPVFVRVTLHADDDLEAEAAAVACLRGVTDIKVSGATIAFRSMIAPACIPL